MEQLGLEGSQLAPELGLKTTVQYCDITLKVYSFPKNKAIALKAMGVYVMIYHRNMFERRTYSEFLRIFFSSKLNNLGYLTDFKSFL